MSCPVQTRTEVNIPDDVTSPAMFDDSCIQMSEHYGNAALSLGML